MSPQRQPVGEAQNPLGQTFTPQTKGNRVQGGGYVTGGQRYGYPMQEKKNLQIAGISLDRMDHGSHNSARKQRQGERLGAREKGKKDLTSLNFFVRPEIKFHAHSKVSQR